MAGPPPLPQMPAEPRQDGALPQWRRGDCDVSRGRDSLSHRYRPVQADPHHLRHLGRLPGRGDARLQDGRGALEGRAGGQHCHRLRAHGGDGAAESRVLPYVRGADHQLRPERRAGRQRGVQEDLQLPLGNDDLCGGLRANQEARQHHGVQLHPGRVFGGAGGHQAPLQSHHDPACAASLGGCGFVLPARHHVPQQATSQEWGGGHRHIRPGWRRMDRRLHGGGRAFQADGFSFQRDQLHRVAGEFPRDSFHSKVLLPEREQPVLAPLSGGGNGRAVSSDGAVAHGIAAEALWAGHCQGVQAKVPREHDHRATDAGAGHDRHEGAGEPDAQRHAKIHQGGSSRNSTACAAIASHALGGARAQHGRGSGAQEDFPRRERSDTAGPIAHRLGEPPASVRCRVPAAGASRAFGKRRQRSAAR
mmetsp:Transcript_12545/g.46386  ORF Transcript_12545/g.46386 Transcript_12545/m.46386 type:complete len:419 (+) Transcript_12545:1031-2287(+)